MTKLPGVKSVAVLTLALMAASQGVCNAEDAFVPVSKASARAGKTPLKVIMEMHSETNPHLRGTLLELTELSVETAFGTASIPLHAVAGMRLPSKDEPMTTIILSNGDSVTGKTQLHKLFVQTEWGKAEVDAPSVVAMTFKDGLTWTVETSLAGNRWTLVDQTQAPQVYYQY